MLTYVNLVLLAASVSMSCYVAYLVHSEGLVFLISSTPLFFKHFLPALLCDPLRFGGNDLIESSHLDSPCLAVGLYMCSHLLLKEIFLLMTGYLSLSLGNPAVLLMGSFLCNGLLDK